MRTQHLGNSACPAKGGGSRIPEPRDGSCGVWSGMNSFGSPAKKPTSRSARPSGGWQQRFAAARLRTLAGSGRCSGDRNRRRKPTGALGCGSGLTQEMGRGWTGRDACAAGLWLGEPTGESRLAGGSGCRRLRREGVGWPTIRT
jgi:hypothetical protein